MSVSAASTDDSNSIPPQLVLRGGIGGTLMGLANLVPGISGGTMLLAAGVYPGFIGAIAEVTTLRFRLRSMVTLGSVGVAAALAILLFAGTVKSLVEENRWMMYSLFIGLTLGGVPLVWRMARPADPSLIGGGIAAFAGIHVRWAARCHARRRSEGGAGDGRHGDCERPAAVVENRGARLDAAGGHTSRFRANEPAARAARCGGDREARALSSRE